MDENNQRNILLAFALSLIVMLGWQYFYAGPRLQEEQARRERIAEQQKKTTEQGAARQGGQAGQVTTAPTSTGQGGIPGVESPIVVTTREAALKSTQRIPIETHSIAGSISLTGARIDDLVLKDYKQTIEKDSPDVILLSPSGVADAYYAAFGWSDAAGGSAKTPGDKTEWKTESGAKLTPETPVKLVYDNGEGLIFHRTISVDDTYMFTVRDEVENKSATAVTLSPWSLISRHGRPHTVQLPVHEGLVGWLGDQKLVERTYDKIKDQTTVELKQKSGWLGFTDVYWAAVLIPDQKADYTAGLRYFETPLRFQTDLLQAPVTIAGGSTQAVETRLFAGAKRADVIDAYENKLGIAQFGYLIDWGWFWYITRPLFHLLKSIYGVVGNFGLSILGLTLIVKALFFPLANRSYASMTKMKKLQPEMQKLQERFKDDKVKQQQAIMELYKKEKVNPMSGCLPMVVQIPVFFALYKVLIVAIDMRHAPFFGWIRDLSSPDPTNIFSLFGLLPAIPASVPYLHLGIWPIIMGLSMWAQMKLNPAPADPVQAKMFAWMPVIFTFMLGQFASGLVIYWTWNNLLGIIQQSIFMTSHGVKVELWQNLKSDLSWIGRGLERWTGSASNKKA